MRSVSRLTAAVVFLLIAPFLHAATLTWTGVAGANWSNAANWSPAQVPASGDTLVFGVSPTTTVVNDLPAGTTFTSLQFNAPYTVSGNAIGVTTSITSSNCTSVLNLPITIAGPTVQISVPTLGGALNVNGNAVQFSCSSNTLNGPLNGTGTVQPNGTMSPVRIIFDGGGNFSGTLNAAGPFFQPNTTTLSVESALPSATVAGQGVLIGNGTVGTVIMSGSIQPGTPTLPVGTLTTGNFTPAGAVGMPENAGAVAFDIRSSGNDRLRVNGTVNLNNKPLTIIVASGFTPADGQQFMIVENDGADPVQGIFHQTGFSFSPIPEGSIITVGAHRFRITYQGGTGNDVVLTYTPELTATTTTINSTPNPSQQGQSVTLTATVSPTVTSGTVTFYRNGTPIGTAPATNATITVDDLPLGTSTLTATFSGNSSFATSTSAPRQHTVTEPPRNVQITATPGPVEAGSPTTITVTVAPASGGGTPTGTVTASEGSTTYDTEVLSGGTATLTIPPLPPGTHTITITYGGDASFNPGSTAVNLTVDVVSITVQNVETEEGDSGSHQVTVRVSLTSAATVPVTVSYTTRNAGSAEAGSDYQATSGTLTFAPGETVKTVPVTIFGDVQPEGHETFQFVLSNASGARISRSSAIVRIVNDDPFHTLLQNLEYANVDGVSLRLNLRLPVTNGFAAPVIVAIEADDWSSPSRNGQIAARQADRGYAVATIAFRSSDVAKFPAQVEDVKAAVRWLRAHASEYGLDPNRIALWGIGAGGHLAAVAGTSGDLNLGGAPTGGNEGFSSRVQAVLDWYGPVDFLQLDADLDAACGAEARDVNAADSPESRLLGCPVQTCPTAAQAANPITYVSPDDPPFLIMHGSSDCIVPLVQSERLAAALAAAGVDADLYVVPGASRGSAAWENATVAQIVDEFFDDALRAGSRRRSIGK